MNQQQVPATSTPAEDPTQARILRDIKNGVIAACFSLATTVLITLLATARGGLMGYSVWNFVDVGLIAVLALGIYRKSRIAATVMLVYFVVSKILEIFETGNVSGLLLGGIFAYYYTRAMLATFQYHRRLAAQA